MQKTCTPELKHKATRALRILFFALFLSIPFNTIAQVQIGGTVTDSAGYTLPGATVSVKGTSKGTVTDNDGKFTLSVPDNNSVLVISYLGYQTHETMVGNNPMLNVALASSAKTLDEAVVTSLGIKHAQKTLGYSVTKVNGSGLTDSREVNVMNSLEGKVAGLNISNVASGPSGSTNILIRGSNSISGNNQPLFVIDGIPIDNSNLGAAGEWGGYDAGDAMAGINPDDVADVTILKGAAASALYGARAAGGVIIINTRRGIAQKGIGVSFNSNLTFDQGIDHRDFQSQYGQGVLGSAPQSQTEALNAGYSSWGGLLDGSSVVQFDGINRPYSYVSDNFQNFYRTGTTTTNTLSLNAGNNDAAVLFSGSYLKNQPIVPNSSFERTSFSLNGDWRLGKKLTATASGRYITEDSKNRSNLSDGPGNPNAGIAFLPTSYSVKDIENNYVDADGQEIPLGDVFVTNPYFAAFKFQNNETKNRLIGSIQLKYQITSGLYAKGRVTNDWYNFSNQNITPSGTAYSAQGSMTKDLRNVSEINWEGILGYVKNLTPMLSLDAFVGANRQDNKFTQNTLGGNVFSIDGLYTEANLLNKTAGDFISKSRVNSVFGSAELGFKDYLYLTLTGRNDWFSTLSINNNHIFYPSAGLSFIFSDAFKVPAWMSFGKLRLSFAQVGGGAPNPYSLALTYGLDGAHNGEPLGQVNESILPNPDLKPRQIQELEVGFDLRFWQDRLGIDFAVYNKKTTDDIVQAAVSEASGFTGVYLNIGEVTNKGVELLVHAMPIKMSKFQWETSVNLANNTNKVVNITGDTAVQSISLGGSRVQTTNVFAVVGLPTAQIGGSAFETDANGQIVNANGLPVATAKVQYFGTGIAPFQAGWSNTFKFGHFGFNFLIDMKSGAKIFSGSNAEAAAAGLTTETLQGRGGDNNFIAPGVDETTGQANSTSVKPWDYWGTVVSTITEPFVYSANFGKLRQVGISYFLPSTIIKGTTFQGATISVVVRNVALLWSDVPNIDPETNFNNSNAQGLEQWGVPTTRSYELNLNFSF
ncbi:MAG TPA: SusC/RagA family TonB-linked outer membrane protein [Chitinophagales bacterium]|nr:SusC/RagA family TonB-linked outer membrane protein [Chitinophagales bacterium]